MNGVILEYCFNYLIYSSIFSPVLLLEIRSWLGCPFEIIPLQTTRKENNWKTEEALARAAVTLETERIKGSNP